MRIRVSSSRGTWFRRRPTTRSRITSSPSNPSRNAAIREGWAAARAAAPPFWLLVRGQTALLEQCVDRRIAAAKGAVELHRIAGVAGAVYVLQTRRQCWIEDIAGFGKRGKAIGVQHLRPQIRIISSGVAAAGEEVLEVGRAMT